MILSAQTLFSTGTSHPEILPEHSKRNIYMFRLLRACRDLVLISVHKNRFSPLHPLKTANTVMSGELRFSDAERKSRVHPADASRLKRWRNKRKQMNRILCEIFHETGSMCVLIPLRLTLRFVWRITPFLSCAFRTIPAAHLHGFTCRVWTLKQIKTWKSRGKNCSQPQKCWETLNVPVVLAKVWVLREHTYPTNA